MPLIYTQESPSAIAESLVATATDAQPSFLVVYASHKEDGQSWCGDCREAEPILERLLGSRSQDVKVVYSGLKPEWQKPEAPMRQAPFLIEKLPTIIKVAGDGKWLRLVEHDVLDEKKLVDFIGKEVDSTS